MGDNSAIEWTDATWNPVRGCSRVSKGCDNCYAIGQAHRQNVPGGAYEGLTVVRNSRLDWTGVTRFVPELLDLPLGWKKPRRVFVDSMSDLFHPTVTTEQLDKVFAVMALAERHTFQVLTKRPERMADYASDPDTKLRVGKLCREHPLLKDRVLHEGGLLWPLENVCLGTSVEDQPAANARVQHLLRTPAVVRFLSCEPLLGPVDLRRLQVRPDRYVDAFTLDYHDGTGSGEVIAGPPSGYGPVDWVIVGGESGHGARPMHPSWPRSLRDQCKAAGVPYFFKQWGNWSESARVTDPHNGVAWVEPDGRVVGSDKSSREAHMMTRRSKHVAGRLLDGKTWDQFPAVTGGRTR